MRKLILFLLLSVCGAVTTRAQNGFMMSIEDIFSIMQMPYPKAVDEIKQRGFTCTHGHELAKMPGTYQQKRTKEGEVRLLRNQSDTNKVAGLLFAVHKDSIRLFADEMVSKGFSWKNAQQKLTPKRPVPATDTELFSNTYDLLMTLYKTPTSGQAYEVRIVWRDPAKTGTGFIKEAGGWSLNAKEAAGLSITR